jgi:hypothetical protein
MSKITRTRWAESGRNYFAFDVVLLTVARVKADAGMLISPEVRLRQNRMQKEFNNGLAEPTLVLWDSGEAGESVELICIHNRGCML